jgi:hypothetical protein
MHLIVVPLPLLILPVRLVWLLRNVPPKIGQANDTVLRTVLMKVMQVLVYAISFLTGFSN